MNTDDETRLMPDEDTSPDGGDYTDRDADAPGEDFGDGDPIAPDEDFTDGDPDAPDEDFGDGGNAPDEDFGDDPDALDEDFADGERDDYGDGFADGSEEFEDDPEDEDIIQSRAAAEEARNRSARSRQKRQRMVKAQKVFLTILAGAAAALAVVYVGGCIYFYGHFGFNTTLNGSDVSLQNEASVEETLLAASEDYVLTIYGRGGMSDTIASSEIALEPVFDGSIGTVIKEQSSFSWPLTLFRKTDLTSTSNASYDEAALTSVIAGLAFFDAGNVVEPQDATYALGADGLLTVVAETEGTDPDVTGLTDAIVVALNGFVSELTLDDSCYKAADILSDNAQLAETIDALNELLDFTITVRFTEEASETIDADELMQWITTADGTFVASADSYVFDAVMPESTGPSVVLPADSEESTEDDSAGNDDTAEEDVAAVLTLTDTDAPTDAAAGGDSEQDGSGGAEDSYAVLTMNGVFGTSFTFNEAMIREYVNALADEYDTYGLDHEFETTGGDTVTVPGGNYGWLMDRETTAAALVELVMAGGDGTLEVTWTQTAETFGTDDIGDTYAEVDLDEQRVYLYVEGELILSTDCVSGKAISSDRYTPDGVFRITYRKSPATLTGADYVSYVTYWMPFNSGIGFHDATWRSSFGGEIYLTNGSHGCINLPSSAAETLYEYVYTGMPVIVFGGMLPEEAIEYTGVTPSTDTDTSEEEESTEVTTVSEEDQEAAIIAQAEANYVATGMTEEEAAAQVQADLAEQLAAQQAAAEAAAQAAAQTVIEADAAAAAGE